MADTEFETHDSLPGSSRGGHLEAAQAFYARAGYLLQRDAVDEYDPGFAGNDDYDPGFAGRDDYDPGFSEQEEPVLDLTLDEEPPYGRGGQEYYPGFGDFG